MLRNRKVAVNILIAAFLVMDILFMPVASAYDEPDRDSTLKASASYNGVYAYTAATLGLFGDPVYMPGRNAYVYNYRITGWEKHELLVEDLQQNVGFKALKLRK
ncbi:MAG: hypothetical protein GX120_04480 [Methanosarcina mazei]|nr:hypothetical protein [Methanosarcina mazei]